MATVTIVRTTSSSQIGSLLSQASASTTYLTQLSASSTYLTQLSASSTYLTQLSASSTYLTQLSASTQYVRKSGANYAISNSTSTTVNNTTPTTIASLTITTNGRPIFLNSTGDMNPIGARSWNYLQIYRDSTAIGKFIIIEGTESTNNQGYALTHIDTPVAGTYTYTVKAYNGLGSTIYGETGNSQAPTLIAIELF
jgi:hypothetical protein